MGLFWVEGNFFHCPCQILLLLEVNVEIHWNWKGAIIAIILDCGIILKKKKKSPKVINILQYI